MDISVSRVRTRTLACQFLIILHRSVPPSALEGLGRAIACTEESPDSTGEIETRGFETEGVPKYRAFQ